MKRTLQLALREVPAKLRLRYHAAGLATAIATLAYLGPFDTWGRLPLSDRLVFWTLATGVNWLFGMLVGIVAVSVCRRRGWPVWVGAVGASLAAAVPGTGAVWALVAAWMGYRMGGLSEIASLYVQVTAIHLVLSLLVVYLIERRTQRLQEREGDGADRPPPPGEPADAPDSAPFLDRLPARLGRNLQHLHMQDHYVEAHTDEGSDLVLLRFRDALREVDAIDGAQVHRSHWVARAAVTGVERRNGRIALRLANGNEVPVSRSFAPTLRKHGWL